MDAYGVIELRFLQKGTIFSYKEPQKDTKFSYSTVIRNDWNDTGLVMVEDPDGQYRQVDGMTEVYI